MGSYYEHQQLIKKFKVAIQKEITGIRLYDRHVGLFYTKNRAPIKINKKGMADCYALYSTKIGLLHLELEFKTGKAIQSKHQKTWQKFIESNNGFYLVINDVNSGINDIKLHLEKIGNLSNEKNQIK